MTATLQHRGTETITVTTDHAASSYGQPVLTIGGQAHGPDDLVKHGSQIVAAAQLVGGLWACYNSLSLTDEEDELVQQFIRMATPPAPRPGSYADGEVA